MTTLINTQTFNLTAGDTSGPVIDISQADFISIQVDGTFVGTLLFRTGLDGVNFNSYNLHKSSEVTATTDTNNTTTVGLFSKPCTALKYFHVMFTSLTSGTANITFVESILAK